MSPTTPRIIPAELYYDETAIESAVDALVEEAARRLSSSFPHRSEGELSSYLRRRLREEQEKESLYNMDDWSERAPKLLARLVRSLSNTEAWRRRKIENFFRKAYQGALKFARNYLWRREDIEDAVGLAFIALHEGKTEAGYFNRKLRDICVDRLRELDDERKYAGIEVSPDDFRVSMEQRDPLNVLMDRRYDRAKRLLVGQAKKRPKWRDARRKQWAQPLIQPRGELAVVTG